MSDERLQLQMQLEETSEISRLRSQLNEQSLRMLEMEVGGRSAANARERNLTSEVRSLRQQLAQRQDAAGQYAEQARSSQRSLKNVAAERADLQERLQRSESKRRLLAQELTQRLGAIEKECHTLRARANEAERQMMMASVKADASHRAMELKNAEYALLERKLKQTLAELASQREKAQQVAPLRERISTLSLEMARREEDFLKQAKRAGMAADLKIAVDNLKAQVEEAKRKVAEREARSALLERELAETRTRCDRAEAAMEEREDELVQSQREAASAASDLEGTRLELEAMRIRLDSARQHSESLERDVASLSNLTGVSTATKEESESAHILELRGALQKRSEQVAALRREVESWKKEQTSSRQTEGGIMGVEVDKGTVLGFVRLVRGLTRTLIDSLAVDEEVVDFDKILMGDAEADSSPESPSLPQALEEEMQQVRRASSLVRDAIAERAGQSCAMQ